MAPLITSTRFGKKIFPSCRGRQGEGGEARCELATHEGRSVVMAAQGSAEPHSERPQTPVPRECTRVTRFPRRSPLASYSGPRHRGSLGQPAELLTLGNHNISTSTLPRIVHCITTYRGIVQLFSQGARALTPRAHPTPRRRCRVQRPSAPPPSLERTSAPLPPPVPPAP